MHGAVVYGNCKYNWKYLSIYFTALIINSIKCNPQMLAYFPVLGRLFLTIICYVLPRLFFYVLDRLKIASKVAVLVSGIGKSHIDSNLVNRMINEWSQIRSQSKFLLHSIISPISIDFLNIDKILAICPSETNSWSSK